MSKSPASDLFSTLRTYLTKLSEGERTPQEVAAAFNGWAKESAEALKSKIHEEVEAAVLKMGFVKRDEFDRLAAKVANLEGGKVKVAKSAVKKSAAKKSAVKKRAVK